MIFFALIPTSMKHKAFFYHNRLFQVNSWKRLLPVSGKINPKDLQAGKRKQSILCWIGAVCLLFCPTAFGALRSCPSVRSFQRLFILTFRLKLPRKTKSLSFPLLWEVWGEYLGVVPYWRANISRDTISYWVSRSELMFLTCWARTPFLELIKKGTNNFNI